MYQVLLKR